MRVVYHDEYNFPLRGDHPFDTEKYRKAWGLLLHEYGATLWNNYWHKTSGPVSRQDLLRVHTPKYLDSLMKPGKLGSILGVSLPGISPKKILRPLQLATQGTIEAARIAMTEGSAINLGGGYHHAHPDSGGGFCVFADVAIAVHCLRDEGLLKPGDKIAYIDVDAHFGNGVAACFQDDPNFRILDIHGFLLGRPPKKEDVYLSVGHRETGASYLSRLKKSLPGFLDACPTTLAIINAGTDPYEEDELGGMHLSYNEMVRRDRWIIQELKQRGIPWFLVTSGGYSATSYKFLAETASFAIRPRGRKP